MSLKHTIITMTLVLVTTGCQTPLSPVTPTPQDRRFSGQSAPGAPAAPTPAPSPQATLLTCANAVAEIYDGPDPDKAHARITVPAGQWMDQAPQFELIAYPVPLTNPNDVDSTGRWPVTPGTTQEFRTDKPSVRAHQIDARCNDQVIASKTGGS